MNSYSSAVDESFVLGIKTQGELFSSGRVDRLELAQAICYSSRSYQVECLQSIGTAIQGVIHGWH